MQELIKFTNLWSISVNYRNMLNIINELWNICLSAYPLNSERDLLPESSTRRVVNMSVVRPDTVLHLGHTITTHTLFSTTSPPLLASDPCPAIMPRLHLPTPQTSSSSTSSATKHLIVFISPWPCLPHCTVGEGGQKRLLCFLPL